MRREGVGGAGGRAWAAPRRRRAPLPLPLPVEGTPRRAGPGLPCTGTARPPAREFPRRTWESPSPALLPPCAPPPGLSPVRDHVICREAERSAGAYAAPAADPHSPPTCGGTALPRPQSRGPFLTAAALSAALVVRGGPPPQPADGRRGSRPHRRPPNMPPLLTGPPAANERPQRRAAAAGRGEPGPRSRRSPPLRRRRERSGRRGIPTGGAGPQCRAEGGGALRGTGASKCLYTAPSPWGLRTLQRGVPGHRRAPCRGRAPPGRAATGRGPPLQRLVAVRCRARTRGHLGGEGTNPKPVSAPACVPLVSRATLLLLTPSAARQSYSV